MQEVTLLNNRYQLETSLGSGGMAMVYRARDLMLERTVAIKILREDFSSDLAFRERFRQEARAVANLSHPNIVTVHDFGLDSARLFIVMENVPGADLKTILQRRGRFGVEEALPILVQACAGIGYAHRAGLVHCDIKPQNLLVTPDQRLKVADFGIARAMASIQPNERYNIVWGSPQYFSPEQAAGSPPSPASDVYSLGVVMFEMLTGQLPFMGASAAELARMHRDMPPPSARQLNPAIPASLEQILLKVLSKEPSARYRTADQLGRVLMNINRAMHAETETQEPRQEETAPKVYSVPSRAPVAAPAPLLAPPVSNSAPRPVQSFPAPEAQLVPQNPTPKDVPQSNPLDIDWITVGLGLLALIAVGGLVPFWLWIYMLYNSPFK